MSCGVGCRCGSDLTLLWLWLWMAAAAPIQPLAWELPHAMSAALKSKTNKQTNKKTHQNWKLLQFTSMTIPSWNSHQICLPRRAQPVLPGIRETLIFSWPLWTRYLKAFSLWFTLVFISPHTSILAVWGCSCSLLGSVQGLEKQLSWEFHASGSCHSEQQTGDHGKRN